jgi:N-acetyl-anhydromuramyl-L-alanine amidase AmpD
MILERQSMPKDRDWLWPWEKAPNWVQGTTDNGTKGSADADDETGKSATTGAGDSKKTAKKPPQYTLSSAEIVVPDEGLKEGKSYGFKGTMRRLEGTVSSSAKISVQAVYRYKKDEQVCGNPLTVEINKDTLGFEGKFDELFEPNAYDLDKEKPADAKYKLLLKFRGDCLDKDGFSKEVELPMAANWSVENGMIIHKNITKKPFPALEHGSIENVNAIVLHRTGGDSLDGIFSLYADPIKGKSEAAAHFYINSAGEIFQVGRIDRILWHVGAILSKDYMALNGKIDWIPGKEAELLKSAINANPQEKKYLTDLETASFKKQITLDQYFKDLFDHEKTKSYPKRWPYNPDSIGIEITGRFNDQTSQYAPLTAEQEKSILLLMQILIDQFALDPDQDIYPHGGIANKKPCEGKEVLSFIKKHPQKKDGK